MYTLTKSLLERLGPWQVKSVQPINTVDSPNSQSFKHTVEFKNNND